MTTNCGTCEGDFVLIEESQYDVRRIDNVNGDTVIIVSDEPDDYPSGARIECQNGHPYINTGEGFLIHKHEKQV